MVAHSGAGRALAVLLLLLVIVGGSQEPRGASDNPAEELSDAELTAHVLLELSSPAVRYLRAFTVPCWRPAPPLPSGPLDGSWAVALVTLWNDLTAPNNGLGRLVTAQQLHAEAAAMLGEERYNDSLAILELSVLLRLYPFQPPGQLAPWQRSMALAGVAHPRVRLQLARTLVLVARARAGAGAAGAGAAGMLTHADLELLEGAMLAADAAVTLFWTEGVRHEEGPADPSQLPQLNQRITEQVAALLNSMTAKDLKALAAERGAAQPRSGQRRALLEALLPAIRVPLQLAEAASRGGGGVQADAAAPPRYKVNPAKVADWDLYRAVVADVLTLLPSTLLQEVGIQCDHQGSGAAACLEEIDSQLEGQAQELGPKGTHRREVEQLLGQADMVEEVLWRLEEVMVGAAAGVRMADGTTWLRQLGWDWQLSPSLHARLYPPGVAVPDHDLVPGPQRGHPGQPPQQPPGGEQLCLDKTFLLDTVVRMDLEALQGVQYALDNLHYAQFSAGGPERFWQLAGSQQLELGLNAAHRAQLAQLLSSKYGASAPADLEEILGGGGAGGASASDHLGIADGGSDPFIAAFLSFCVLGAASLYVYGNRHSLTAVLQASPWGAGARSGGGSGGLEGSGSGRSMAQRNAATAALREALAAGDARRLAAAIDAAEESGVEKLLVKKARTAMQALRKKRSQQAQQGSGNAKQPAGAGPGGGGGAAASHAQNTRLAPSSSSASSSSEIAEPPLHDGGGLGRRPGGLAAGGSSSSRASSVSRSLSEGAASLAQAAWEAQRDGGGGGGGGGGGALAPAESSAAPPAAAVAGKRKGEKGGGGGGGGGSNSVGSGCNGGQGSGQGLAQAPAAVLPVRTSTDGKAGAVAGAGEKRARRRATQQAQQAEQAVPEQTISRNTSGESDPPTSPGTPMELYNPSRSTSGQQSLDPPSPRPDTPTQRSPKFAAAGAPAASPKPHLPPASAGAATAAAAAPRQSHGSPAPHAAAGKEAPSSPHDAAGKPAGNGQPKVILAPRPTRAAASPGKKATAVPGQSPAKAVQALGAVAPPPPPPPKPDAQQPAAGQAATTPSRKAPGATKQSPVLPGSAPGGGAAAAAGAHPSSPFSSLPRDSGKQRPLAPLQPAGGAGPAPEATVTFVSAAAQGAAAGAAARPDSYRRSLSDSSATRRRAGQPVVVSPPRPPPPPPPRNPASSSSSPAGAGAGGVGSPAQPAQPTSVDASPREGRSGGWGPTSPYGSSQADSEPPSPYKSKSWPRSGPAGAHEPQGDAYAQQGGAQYNPFGPAPGGPPSLFADADSYEPTLAAPSLAPSLAPSRAASLFEGESLSSGGVVTGAGLARAGSLFEQEPAAAAGAAVPPLRPVTSAPPSGATPELLASLQQIWSGVGAGEGGGGGGGSPAPTSPPSTLRPGAAPHVPRASVELPPHVALLPPGAGKPAGVRHSLFDSSSSLLAPAPELAWWHGRGEQGGGAGGMPPHSAGFAAAPGLGAGWPLQAATSAGDAMGLLERSLGAGSGGGGDEDQSGALGSEDLGISLDLASLGFTELGD